MFTLMMLTFGACSKFVNAEDTDFQADVIDLDIEADEGQTDLILTDITADTDGDLDVTRDVHDDYVDIEQPFPDIPPLECSSNRACEREYDNLPVCYHTFCDPWVGICLVAPIVDGTDCETEDYCITESHCLGGVCIGSTVVCDDNNPCTDDSCDPKKGCVHVPNKAECSDNNPCTENDKCSNSVCRAGTNTCDCALDGDCADNNDNNVCNGSLRCIGLKCVLDQTTIITCPGTQDFCMANTCNPVNGSCSPTPVNEGSTCNDQDDCTLNDVCRAGVCAGDVAACDDNNPCTTDSCTTAGGCTHELNTATCNDGNACTTDDMCVSGMCIGTRNPECGCIADAECAAFEDGNLCNGTLTCENGQCVINPLTTVRCYDPIGKPCQRSVCTPATGRCSVIKLEDNRPCVDDNSCTFDEVCADGECVGFEVPCDDDNLCTDDFCDRFGGCNHSYNTMACEDGDPCSVQDKCVNGNCIAGIDRECDDGKPCTIDKCSSSIGCYAEPVVETGVTCLSTDLCIINATCTNGLCVGTRKNCEDGDPCTDNYCDSADGTCKKRFNSEPCEDGNICTIGETCSGGNCINGRARDCSDTDPCTADRCIVGTGCVNDHIMGCEHCPSGLDAECVSPYPCKLGTCDMSSDPLGRCVWTQDPCEDNNPCTTGNCNEWIGECRYEPVYGACNDNNKCTLNDQCNSSTMQCVGTPTVCNDGDVCTDDYCDLADGACKTTFNSAPCVDDDPCSINEFCLDGTCVFIETKDCEDGDACTDNFCDPITGFCRETINAAECEDGDPCTVGDYCELGNCLTGNPKNCSDNNECTADVCRAGDGECLHTPTAGISCGAANKCIISGTCNSAGTCDATYKTCDDQKFCTNDSCNPTSGLCIYTPNTLPCNDGNACTISDVCFNGLCSGTDRTCNDSIACTNDSCNTSTGCVFTPADALCDDNNVCTIDTCVAGQGCTHVPVSNSLNLSCSDGLLCTLSDVCIDGTCKGVQKNCADQIVCTADSCNASTGDCVNPYYIGPCDDGNPCTENDACGTGRICFGTTRMCDDQIQCTVDYCDSVNGCTFVPMNEQCDDANKCTVDTCVAGVGCTHTPVTQAITCDDANPCTTSDTCNTTTGICAGIINTCNDNNVCTRDTCSANGTCQYSAQAGPCNDNITCTTGDVCNSGICYGTPSDALCDDENMCTTDTCSLQARTCVYTLSQVQTCDDFDQCTENDLCEGTSCAGFVNCQITECMGDPRCIM